MGRRSQTCRFLIVYLWIILSMNPSGRIILVEGQGVYNIQNCLMDKTPLLCATKNVSYIMIRSNSIYHDKTSNCSGLYYSLESNCSYSPIRFNPDCDSHDEYCIINPSPPERCWSNTRDYMNAIYYNSWKISYECLQYSSTNSPHLDSTSSAVLLLTKANTDAFQSSSDEFQLSTPVPFDTLASHPGLTTNERRGDLKFEHVVGIFLAVLVLIAAFVIAGIIWKRRKYKPTANTANIPNNGRHQDTASFNPESGLPRNTASTDPQSIHSQNHPQVSSAEGDEYSEIPDHAVHSYANVPTFKLSSNEDRSAMIIDNTNGPNANALRIYENNKYTETQNPIGSSYVNAAAIQSAADDDYVNMRGEFSNQYEELNMADVTPPAPSVYEQIKN